MPDSESRRIPRYDAIVIGAGIAGMYQLYRLRELGLSVRVFETASGVGGTWYWNRYPGARFDSESYSYGYSFSRELLDEWEWSEHFAAQPETLRYLERVADKFDLRRDIRFDSRVTSATWSEKAKQWEVEIESGERATASFLITAVGILSIPTVPELEERVSFRGRQLHTARWPPDPVDFTAKRVGVVGTGATGIQVITEVAKTVAHLTVFQSTPNFCAPLGNRPIDEETQATIKASYDDIFRRCRSSYGAFLHDRDPRSVFEVSQEERLGFWERLYDEPGFGIWLGNFCDVLTDPAANSLLTEFMKAKIRQRVHDPVTAEKLIPKGHVFGARRVPLESGYYEVYNQPNVTLVDLLEEPILRLTPEGIATERAHYELDLIIYATGFDAVTGAFDHIDITGNDGRRLAEKWAAGPRTLLGLACAGFPNLLTLVGPHNAATFCNIPRCIEQNVEWVTDLIHHMRARGLACVEATAAAEEEWTRHVYEMAERTLLAKTDSWFTGANRNLPHKPRTFYAYAGGAPAYREHCDQCAAAGYAGFQLH